MCVFGGTGRYGRRVVASLIARGRHVRVPTRDSRAAHAILGQSAECVEGDVRDPAFVAQAIKDSDSVVIALSAATPRLMRQRRAIERDAVLGIIGAAERLGTRRLVCFSGYALREDILERLSLRSFGAIMLEVETALRASGLNWTVLGCAPSFELFFSLFRGNAMAAPGGCAAPFPSISEFDVGEIAAQVSIRDDLGGRRLSLTGPDALSVPDAAERMGKILGRRIRLIKPPLRAIGALSAIIAPLVPFPRFLYQSLKLLNNFPAELAAAVPAEYAKLHALFDYRSVSFDDEVARRVKEGCLV